MNYYPKGMPNKDDPLRASDVRERNQKIVLRLIRERGGRGLSQSEAVAATGLRAPTMLRIFSGLETAGYIEALPPLEDEGKERKGRPPVSFAARADALYSLGVEFWVDRVSMGLFDFRGTRLSSSVLSLPADADAQAAVEVIVRAVETVIASCGIERTKILGLGLGAPGQVNVRSRRIVFYPRIAGMRDFPMAERLEERLGIPVSIHNNCSVIALSEYRYGGVARTDSLFMFLLRSGVNGAFIDRGRIYLTADGTTIETGHIPIDYRGNLCSCGARGCLESYIASLSRRDQEEGRCLFEGLAPALESGDSEAEETLRVAARYLACACRSVQRLLNPRSFLVVTSSERVSFVLARYVQESLQDSPSGFDRPPEVFEGKAYDPALAQRGAADLVLDAFLG